MQAVAHSLRDRMVERYNDTEQIFDEKGARRVYYLSLEFLMGRTLVRFFLKEKNSLVEKKKYRVCYAMDSGAWFLYVCMYVCMYACMHACKHACIHTHIHT